ncbi:hypothetical protein [Streptomyces sp. 11x1]|uniref:hypothetical protein n=1 Tax=Streptomyces sp. 11x1 TaxID=3038642 RepID=UPI002931BD63|nr:hypothetical protein [Streptomyces sp. 11x1]WNZ09400.1 hypothetical protein P8T65_18615 [Streptomyces sp. 11x1]
MGALMNASGHVEGAEVRVVKLPGKTERATEAAGGKPTTESGGEFLRVPVGPGDEPDIRNPDDDHDDAHADAG